MATALCWVQCVSSAALGADPSGALPTRPDTLCGRVPLRAAEVERARTVRTLIAELCAREAGADVIASLEARAAAGTLTPDTSLARWMRTALASDSSFVVACRYVADLHQHWRSVASLHFVFYFRGGDAPAAAMMSRWDRNFERLATTFGSSGRERVPFVLDGSEIYGRAFPPWDVRWGIRKAHLDANTHELVHIMLFEWSDAPFFHEPLAFLYGTDQADRVAISKRVRRCERTIADSGYFSATTLLHMPQIIGARREGWASAICFVHGLTARYGLPKLMALMRMTPWKADDGLLARNFKTVYDINLETFEAQMAHGHGR